MLGRCARMTARRPVPSAHSSNNKQLELVNATMSVNWQSEEDVARQFENERQGQRVLHDNPILQPGRGVELAVPFVDTQSLDRGVRNVNFTVKVLIESIYR